MIIIGIDPGFDRLGVAIIEKKVGESREIVLFTECFSTDRKELLNERCFVIGEHIDLLINIFSPSLLSIETLYATNNQKTVMGVSEVRGIIKYIARKRGLQVVEYTPQQIKLAIAGSGGAAKEQIQFMVPKLVSFNIDERKKAYKGISSGLDDELDALAVALTASACSRN